MESSFFWRRTKPSVAAAPHTRSTATPSHGRSVSDPPRRSSEALLPRQLAQIDLKGGGSVAKLVRCAITTSAKQRICSAAGMHVLASRHCSRSPSSSPHPFSPASRGSPPCPFAPARASRALGSAPRGGTFAHAATGAAGSGDISCGATLLSTAHRTQRALRR